MEVKVPKEIRDYQESIFFRPLYSTAFPATPACTSSSVLCDFFPVAGENAAT